MILGISSYAFGWNIGLPGHTPALPMEEEELLLEAERANVRCVQIADNLLRPDWPHERLLRFRNMAQSRQIRIEVGARGLDERNLNRHVEICQTLGAPLLRMVVDAPGILPSPADVSRIINNCLPALQASQLTLAIENHDRLGARSLAGVMESIGNQCVGICLDTANSLGAGEGLAYVLDILGPYTVNLHIKDFCVSRLEHQMGFIVQGAPVGKGLANVSGLIGSVAKHGRCQSAILEQWVPPLPNLSETTERERQWARDGLAYLQGLEHFKEKDKTIIR
jgi:sugar phosphate isomerase/epimerase